LRNFKAYEEFHFDVMPPALPKLDTNKMFHWSEKSLKRVLLERDEKKWKPVFRRNQIYADCVELSAISSSKLLESITFIVLD